ncbi:MAG: site-specific integrase [Acidobacteriaceae bacterium]|nr:site-specific integrase [Acidobacteriaceae bacterium]
MRERHKEGSVVLDRRIKTWNFFWWASGKRHSKKIGSLRDFPTKASAWKAAKELRHSLETKRTTAPTVNLLVEQYRAEKMPQRLDTNRGYESWIRVHILPRWGQNLITDLQARPVEMWLESLPLAPKSRTHVRGILSSLWNFAMWKQDIPTQVNPISLVTVKGASKRIRQPRSLTVEQFRLLASHLKKPFNTMALLCVCFGLRISECLALRWSDVDWLNSKLRVERGIVEQNVDDVKTPESQQSLYIAAEILDVLKLWKQTTQFSAPDDWMFASPLKLGRLPYSYTGVWRELDRAAKAAGIGHLGTHTFRHSYRMWIDSVGTPIGVQQKLMRHADIRTTMNIYGDAASADMREAHGKIVQLALQA